MSVCLLPDAQVGETLSRFLGVCTISNSLHKGSFVCKWACGLFKRRGIKDGASYGAMMLGHYPAAGSLEGKM